MKRYELLYAISSELTDEKREALIEKFKKFIEERNGQIEKLDKWGMRKLAYPIKFKDEGYYVLVTFSAEPTLIKEMEQVMNITEPIIRKMFVALN